jgi:hypothetical protein
MTTRLAAFEAVHYNTCYIGVAKTKPLILDLLLLSRWLSIAFVGLPCLFSLFEGNRRFEIINGLTLAIASLYWFVRDKKYALRKTEKAKSKERLEEAATWKKITETPSSHVWDAQLSLFPWLVAILTLVNFITPFFAMGIFTLLYKWRGDVTQGFFSFCDWHAKERKRLRLCVQEDKEWTDFSVWVFENKIQRPKPSEFAAVYEKYVASKAVPCPHCNVKPVPEIKCETPQ